MEQTACTNPDPVAVGCRGARHTVVDVAPCRNVRVGLRRHVRIHEEFCGEFLEQSLLDLDHTQRRKLQGQSILCGIGHATKNINTARVDHERRQTQSVLDGGIDCRQNTRSHANDIGLQSSVRCHCCAQLDHDACCMAAFFKSCLKCRRRLLRVQSLESLIVLVWEERHEIAGQLCDGMLQDESH